MTLSDQRRAAIYRAIHDAVTTARITLNRGRDFDASQDVIVAQIELRAFHGVIKALNAEREK